MPVTERLQTMGSWSITLRPDTPRTVRNAISTPWQHIIITPSWVDIHGIDDNGIQAVSMYTGVVLRPGPQFEIGGVGVNWWLGDERGVPHLDQSVGGPTSQSLATWVSQLLNRTPVTAGTIAGAGPVGGNSIAFFRYQSARQALEAVFRYYQVEYRVNNNWTLDYGTAADLYGSTAVATALPKGQGGRELTLKGFRVSDLDYSKDFTDFLSHVTTSGRGGTGSASGLIPGTDFGAYDFHGGNIVRRAFFDTPDAANGFQANYAESVIDRYSDVDYVGLSTDDFVRSTFGPGKYINVYDPDRGLLDEDNQENFQGEVIFPKLVRVIGMSWPVQRGVGVYYRHRASGVSGAITYTDLTPYIEWERAGTRIDVGNPAYSPIGEQFSSSAQAAPVRAGAWDTYTPTISGTGTAVGNGTVVGAYRREGSTLHLDIRWTLGSTSTVGSGGVTFSLPSGVTAVTQTNRFQVVNGHAFDASPGVSNDTFGYVQSGATTIVMQLRNAAGTYVAWAALSATAPFTWTTNDALGLNGTIEVAP